MLEKNELFKNLYMCVLLGKIGYLFRTSCEFAIFWQVLGKFGNVYETWMNFPSIMFRNLEFSRLYIDSFCILNWQLSEFW